MKWSNLGLVLGGAVVALAIIGGFMALDRTTLHLYSSENGDEADRVIRSRLKSAGILASVLNPGGQPDRHHPMQI